MSALEEITVTLKEIACALKGTAVKTKPVVTSNILLKTKEEYIATCERQFAESYGVELPLKDFEEFLDFDRQLMENPQFRRDFKAALPSLIDRQNIVSKTTTNVLRKFMTRAVVIHFTVQKKMADKIVLKDTWFCKCVVEVLTKMHRDKDGNPITERDVYGGFGTTLNNAKDWDGYRWQRKEKEKKITDPNAL